MPRERPVKLLPDKRTSGTVAPVKFLCYSSAASQACFLLVARYTDICSLLNFPAVISISRLFSMSFHPFFGLFLETAQLLGKLLYAYAFGLFPFRWMQRIRERNGAEKPA